MKNNYFIISTIMINGESKNVSPSIKARGNEKMFRFCRCSVRKNEVNEILIALFIVAVRLVT